MLMRKTTLPKAPEGDWKFHYETLSININFVVMLEHKISPIMHIYQERGKGKKAMKGACIKTRKLSLLIECVKAKSVLMLIE